VTKEQNFIDRVETLRIFRQWTWEQTASAIGLSRSMIHLIKKGKNNVTDKVLYRLEQAEIAAGITEKADVNQARWRRETSADVVKLMNSMPDEFKKGDKSKAEDSHIIEDSLRQLSTGELGDLADHFSENRHEAPYGANIFYDQILGLIHAEIIIRTGSALAKGTKTAGAESTKHRLTQSSENSKVRGDMKLPRTVQQMLEDVRRFTKAHGMKAALAKFLGVPQARVSEWLDGKYEPSGKITLKMLHWVEQQERQ